MRRPRGEHLRALRRVALIAATIVATVPGATAGATAGATGVMQAGSPPADSLQLGTQRADSIAADSALEARTTAVAAELRCAVCQGISIQESPSALAREMRDLVKEQLRAGRTPEQVKAYFESKYGEWILLTPRAHGLNILLYLLPAVLLIGGLGFIALIVRRWTAAGAPAGPQGGEGAAPGPDAAPPGDHP